MPHFTLQMSRQRPIVRAEIMVSNPRYNTLTAAGEVVPDPQSIYALIDTESTTSEVDAAVLSALGLSPTGEKEVVSSKTGTASIRVPTYEVCIRLRALRPGDLHFISDTIRVTSANLEEKGLQALVGADVLKKYAFRYDGNDGFLVY